MEGYWAQREFQRLTDTVGLLQQELAETRALLCEACQNGRPACRCKANMLDLIGTYRAENQRLRAELARHGTY